jgi:hypothetical protein
MHHIKLTEADTLTHGRTQWGPGVRHEAKPGPIQFCSETTIHFYSGDTLQEALALAVHMNPTQAAFIHPRAWVFEPEGEVVSSQTKSGCKAGTTVEEVPLPKATLEQRAEVAIRCALKVCSEARWVAWAEKWLSGEDRSEDAAWAEWKAAVAVWSAAGAGMELEEGWGSEESWVAEAAAKAAKAADAAAWALTWHATDNTEEWAGGWAADAVAAALHLDADVEFTKIAVEVYYREAPQ